MSFQNSCYISYREMNSKVGSRFIIDLANELSDRLVDKSLDVFMDWSRLKGEQPNEDNPYMAKALCESVCMVVVYTPIYFSKSYTYCAREYKAMEKLEAERLKLLKESSIDKKQGLIIPVILRGLERIPEEIKERKYYDFEDFLGVGTAINKRQDFKEKIDDIANHILDCYLKFKQIPENNCDNFQLPSDKDPDFKSWLSRVSETPTRFPGHSKSKRKSSLVFSSNS